MSISFCIPTYNRVHLLKQTLDSVISQIDGELEQIVISDNCSSDSTKSLVESYQKKYPFITYHRWGAVVEAGQNLLKSVELAEKDFCWLLTDDDIIESGGVKKVKKALTTFPDLSGLSVGIKGYDLYLQNEKIIRFQHSIQKFHIFSDKTECLKNLGAWLGFWSAQIVRKSYWEEVKKDSNHLKYLGYHHLYLLSHVICVHSRWAFLPDPIIGYRAGNETFSVEHGLLKRFEIDATTYYEIYSQIFGKRSKITKKVCEDVIKYYLFWQLVSVKCQKTKSSTLFRILRCVFPNFYRQRFFWTHFLTLILLPKALVLLIRKVYRLFFKEKLGLK